MKVMFYCQRVLGISHLVRSAEIARALLITEARP